MNSNHTSTCRRLGAIAIAALLASCGGAQTTGGGSQVVTPPIVAQRPESPQTVESPPDNSPLPETPDAPFRAQAPAASPTPQFNPPAITQFRLANGMTVLLVERHDLPIVVTRYVTRHGADDAPIARAGLGQLVGTLIEQGTSHYDAIQFAEQLAAIGADHGARVEWDFGAAYLKVLANHLPRAMELLADEVQNPAFAEAEFTRERSRQLDALNQMLRDAPHLMATVAMYRAVYGETNPYSRPLAGTVESLRALTRNDVVQFHRTHFTPSTSALVVVGDVTRQALQPLLDRHWATWRVPGGRAPAAPAVTPQRAMPRISLVHRANAPQSYVFVAHTGVSRNSPDYVPLQVMNTLLGGMFSSRINLNLREAHAYTYGARSLFSYRRGAGPFTAGGAMVAASTGPAVQEILNELNRIRGADVEANELSAAQSRLVETLPSQFETAENLASAVSDIFIFGLPLDEFATITRRVQAVTVADVHRVAQRYLDPANARIVVVGDRERVTPQLRQLNLGEIQLREANGNVLPATPTSGGSTPAPTPTSPPAGTHAPTAPAH